jgi:hypothetical protein
MKNATFINGKPRDFSKSIFDLCEVWFCDDPNVGQPFSDVDISSFSTPCTTVD